MKKNTLLFFAVIATFNLFSQPFADIVSFNYQNFEAKYNDSLSSKNNTGNYFFNFFLPKEFKNGNTFLLRINSESIITQIKSDTNYSYKVYAVSAPIGIKLVSKNKKWETILIGIPKLASDFRNKINDKDFQYSGIFLQHFVVSEKLKLRGGLYYSREAFGNFFVPLIGIDWKINDKWNMYGILTTNFKVERKLIKDKLYTGLGLKFVTRSFRLSYNQNSDYVRYNEAQVKWFADYFIYKRFLIFAEAGYSIGTNLVQYKNNTEIENYNSNRVFSPTGNFVVFNIGLAYRIRLDLEKKNE